MSPKYVCIILIGMLLHWMNVLFCLQEAGVCEKISSGILVKMCCSDYEEYDDKCVACNPGFTSEIGEHCRPCPVNSFGPKCAGMCTCNVSERCDSVIGCVIDFGSRGDEPNMTTIKVIESEVNNDGQPQIVNATYYYMIIIMTLIFVCFVSFMLFKYKQSSKQKQVPQSMSRHSYAEVDETTMNEFDDDEIASNCSYLEMLSKQNKPKVRYYNENMIPKSETSFDEVEPDSVKNENNIGATARYENSGEATQSVTVQKQSNNTGYC